MLAIDLDQSLADNYLTDDLTAEVDLSDPAHVSGIVYDEDLGVAPITVSNVNEVEPMICTPRSNSRVVRIVSKQSNV